MIFKEGEVVNKVQFFGERALRTKDKRGRAQLIWYQLVSGIAAMVAWYR